jgi:hypothetical protein
MKSLFFISVFFIGTMLFNGATGQTKPCPEVAGFATDYCFTDSVMAGKAVLFKANTDTFYFVPGTGKKAVKLTHPKTSGLAELSGLKKEYAKMTSDDILFLTFALGEWETQKMNIGFITTASGLSYRIDSKGSGKNPEAGKKVKVHYKGYLPDGTKFDSSFDRNQPFEFSLGKGQVIKGWDQGFATMKKGEKAILRCRSDYAYGDGGQG